MSERVPLRNTRRELLQKIWAGLALSGIASMSGCSVKMAEKPQQTPVPTILPSPTPEPKIARVYRGSLKDLRGRPEIGRVELGQILEELIKTKNPFLTHLALGIDTLRSATSTPETLPRWLDPNSFPLPITYDDSGKAFATGYIPPDKPKETKTFKITGSDQSESVYEAVSDMAIGVHLVKIQSSLKQEASLIEGLTLSRLYLTHMLMLKVGVEIFEFLTAQGARFSDAEGQDLNASEREWAGASFYLRTLNNENGRYHAMFGAVPVLMMGIATGSLSREYSFLRKSEHLSLILEAEKELQGNRDAASLLSVLMDVWSGDRGLLPPRGTAGTIFQDGVIKSALVIHEKKKQGPKDLVPQI